MSPLVLLPVVSILLPANHELVNFFSEVLKVRVVEYIGKLSSNAGRTRLGRNGSIELLRFLVPLAPETDPLVLPALGIDGDDGAFVGFFESVSEWSGVWSVECVDAALDSAPLSVVEDGVEGSCSEDWLLCKKRPLQMDLLRAEFFDETEEESISCCWCCWCSSCLSVLAFGLMSISAAVTLCLRGWWFKDMLEDEEACLGWCWSSS